MMTETVVTVEQPTRNGAQPNIPPKSGNALSFLQFNINYFTTIPGYIKIAQLILGIICMACAAAYLSGTHFFLFVVVTAFIATILWSFVYLLGLREAINIPINWILTELLNTGIATLLYFIAFIVQLATWGSYSGYGVARNMTAGVFGIFNFLAYAAGTYFLYIEHKTRSTGVTVNQ